MPIFVSAAWEVVQEKHRGCFLPKLQLAPFELAVISLAFELLCEKEPTGRVR